ncbi:MAG: class I SAM-dependent methyltransferase [Elusimicrobia bacterium]|nr:class I SAM-dependent methyltransferase [Elusimicrobiota bacterium]
MKRLPEKEVMDDETQVIAYAKADFAGVNQAFVGRLLAAHPGAARGSIIDLGCGPADIPIRLAQAAPEAKVTAVDASAPMIVLAKRAVAKAKLEARVTLVEGYLPGLPLPDGGFDVVVSNSLLHQLPDPAAFWGEVKRLVRPGGAVFVMDLFRPASEAEARRIVEAAAAGEDPVLKEDFYNSLLAAFSLEEVAAQLAAAGLPFAPTQASERHLVVSGVPPRL